MNDFDLDRLGDVWRQQPDPAEMERLQRSAAAVSRRARFSQILDVAVAAALAGAAIFLVSLNPRSEAVLAGAAAIVVLLYGNIRQRRLRQVELRSLTGKAEDMLQQSVERVETTLRHHRLTLLAMGPTCLVGVLFGVTVIGRNGISHLSGTPLLRPLLFGGGIAALAAFSLFLLFAIRRGRRELERLKALRDAYRHERESAAN